MLTFKEKTEAVETGKDRLTQKARLLRRGWSKVLNAGGRCNRMTTEVSHYIWPVRGLSSKKVLQENWILEWAGGMNEAEIQTDDSFQKSGFK